MDTNHDNYQLEYIQIMENYRQALRSTAAVIIIYLAINGLIFKIVADNKLSSIYLVIAVLFIIVIGVLMAVIGIIVIIYFKSQQGRMIALSETDKLNLSEDKTFVYVIKIGYISQCGLILIISWWLIFLILR